MSKNKPPGEEKTKTSKSKQQVEPTELQRQPVAEVNQQGRTPLWPHELSRWANLVGRKAFFGCEVT